MMRKFVQYLPHHERFLTQFPTHRQRFPLECRISQVSGREHDLAVTNIFLSLNLYSLLQDANQSSSLSENPYNAIGTEMENEGNGVERSNTRKTWIIV
jgi:hypothetical protein